MYSLKPILTKQEIDLPNCMYKLNPVNSTLFKEDGNSSGNSGKSEVELLEEKQNRILKKLEELKQTLMSMRGDVKPSNPAQKSQQKVTTTKTPSHCSVDLSKLQEIVINVHPSNVPYSILAFQSLWKNFANIEVAVFSHSSINEKDLTPASKEFADKVTSSSFTQSNLPTLKVIIIWKNVASTELLVSSLKFVPVFGESSIVRFLNRVGPSEDCYDFNNNHHFANQTDSVVDICHQLSMRPSKGERQSYFNSLGQKLGKSQYFCDSNKPSAADVAVWSTIKNVCGNNVKELPTNLTPWYQKLSKTIGC